MVFSFFKRRLQFEHRKLAIQNFKAAHDPEMKTLAGLHGEWDAFESYDGAKAHSKIFLRQIIDGLELSSEDIDVAFKINKGLRYLYDKIGRPNRGSFDKVYQPLGGWKNYFERHSTDLYMFESQAKIDASIKKVQEEYERTGVWPDLSDERFYPKF
ncbi:MAG: hypothetical protein U1E13_08440 [Methylophilaceae bacterium]|nr:hypothetical protein [Methylophilaceae bacterium]